MNEIVLKAEPRQPSRSAAKVMRREERVPGVYYTKDTDPIHFHVYRLDLRPMVYTSEAKLVRLEVEGDEPRLCIIKDVAFDPITDRILHVDLYGISAGHKIEVEIPLHLTGSAAGVLEGGVIEHIMHKARVQVDPTQMPEHIDVDVSKLELNQSIHISDLKIEGVEFNELDEAVIASCSMPRVVAEATEEAAEPALVGEEGEGEGAEGSDEAKSEE